MRPIKRFLIPLGVAALVAVTAVVLMRKPQKEVATTLSKPTAQEGRMKTLLDNDKTFPERIKAARELPLEVKSEDLQKLLVYLEAPLPVAGRGEALVSLNEIMQELRLKGRATPEYGVALARIIRNPASDEVVRDYAVQHAVRWMIDSEQTAATPGNQNATLADRELLLSSVAGLLNPESAAQGSAWGTTLNVLRDFKQQSTQPEDITRLITESGDHIRAVAMGDQPAHVGNRVAAIQTLAELPDRDASLGIVRTLLDAPEMQVGHKLPAIAALASLGTAEDMTTLDRLAQTDDRLRYAANAAATRLKEKLSTTAQ